MREIQEDSRAVYVYGAWAAADEAACGVFVHAAEMRGEGALAPTPERPPRERSGVAYAAGAAGGLCLSGFSFAPLAQAGSAWTLGAGLCAAFGLCGPLALACSFVAGLRLDRSPGQSGRPQALFGFVVGWV